MSVTKSEKVSRTYESTRLELACDLCGEPLQAGIYDVAECEIASKISVKEGSVYPEGGSWEGVTYDCCIKCFEEKVDPVLATLGFKPRKIEAGY